MTAIMFSNQSFVRPKQGNVSRMTWGVLVLLLAVAGIAESAQRPLPPRPKNITGVVSDVGGQPIPEARVSIQNLETGVTRTHLTNDSGVYSVNGLPPGVDYEVYAEFEGQQSERRVVSGLLNRPDNVLAFSLDVVMTPALEPGIDAPGSLNLETFDLVQLQGSFQSPRVFRHPYPRHCCSTAMVKRARSGTN